MNRSVTPEETRQLFEFCEKKGVKYYDVQTELVDHLASDIEDIWKTEPNKYYEDALIQSFNKFGKDGFVKLTEIKRKELMLKYQRLLLGFLKEFYNWPKIALTVIISICLYLISNEFKYNLRIFILFSSFLVILGSIFLIVSAFQDKRNNLERKQFLFSEIYILMKRGALSFANLPLPYLFISKIFEFELIVKQNWILFIISFLYIALCILIFGQYFVIPKMIKQHFKEQFPEYASK